MHAMYMLTSVGPGETTGVEYRALEDDDSFYGLIEQDAVAIVEAALWIGAH